MWDEKTILEFDTTNEEKARFAEQAFLMSQGMPIQKAVVEGNRRAAAGELASPLAKKLISPPPAPAPLKRSKP